MAGTWAEPVRTNEGIRVQEGLWCLLCRREGRLQYQGLRDRLFAAPGVWALRRCSECGLLWLDPHPVADDIGKLYEQYFTHGATNGAAHFADLWSTVRNAVLAARLGYDGLAGGPLSKGLGKFLSSIGPIREMVELSVMALDASRKGKLLDVGCGSGQFLAEMRALGWETVGVEPDREAVKIGRERLGLCIYEGRLEEADFPEESFDAITMHHVIEHVPNPIGFLQACHRLLKPGGKLVAVTPNIESLGHYLFKKSWLHLDPPRHLYLFSPYTLIACAERAGIQVSEIRSTARKARWAWAASCLIRRNGALPGGTTAKKGFWLHLGGLVFQAVEQGICCAINAGEELILIATKLVRTG
jgi:2-polyprenyl-3-methyl-5-hydroxy-6-metoxy-1,4-benzoquinol methylase